MTTANPPAVRSLSAAMLEKPTKYLPFASEEEIELSVSFVRDYICVPTKSGKLCDDRQAIRFIMLCKARRLNPFEGDAFLLGYDGQNGPEFSLITAHQAFLKRAESSPDYDGMESGVVVQRGKEIIEEEGDLTLASDTLLGGWAKVYRKDQSHPTYRRLKLSTFNTGYSRWKKDPAGMIVKCAEADALRSSFPTLLAGMYADGETGAVIEGSATQTKSVSERKTEQARSRIVGHAPIVQERSTPNGDSATDAHAEESPGPEAAPAGRRDAADGPGQTAPSHPASAEPEAGADTQPVASTGPTTQAEGSASSPDDLERAETVRNIRQAIPQCRSPEHFADARQEIDRVKMFIGDEAGKLLFELAAQEERLAKEPANAAKGRRERRTV